MPATTSTATPPKHPKSEAAKVKQKHKSEAEGQAERKENGRKPTMRSTQPSRPRTGQGGTYGGRHAGANVDRVLLSLINCYYYFYYMNCKMY